MLTASPPTATPLSRDSTNTAKAATVSADAQARFRDRMRAENAQAARQADQAAAEAASKRTASQLPDPMSSLSTVAVAGALNSLPATLNMMRSIVMASATGELSDADRQALQAEYAQLNAHAVSAVGSAGAAQQAQTSTDHDDEREDNAENTWREDSDDHRSTLTRTQAMPRQTVQYQPVERTYTVQTQTLVEDGHGPRKDPREDFRTHELHVGADSYEPPSMRQSFTHPVAPATLGREETHAETRHSFVAQAAQITQFVQVAQTEHLAPIRFVA